MFVMPAEWGKHKMTYVAWPVNRLIWGEKYTSATNSYESLIRKIACFEPVRLLVSSKDIVAVIDRFSELGELNFNVDIISVEIDDGWVRDSGPTYIRDGSGIQKILNWRFNAWGEKYPHYENDTNLPLRISQMDKLELINAPLCFEGGAFCVDGEGTMLTTESVVLNSNRNPGLDKWEAEKYFKYFLGIKKVIWLPQGLCSDETDGHVDNLAAFVAPGVVVALTCSDLSDENYDVLKENLAILCRETDAQGRSLEVVQIEQPESIFNSTKRLTASYINFYFLNNAILAPVFGQSKDTQAINAIKQVAQSREVIPFHANDLIVGGGAVHCVTQQWPI